MNFFDDYYSESQPQQEQTNYIPQEELLEPASPVEPKPRKGLRRIVCAVVALALVAGSCGITAGLMNRRFEKELQILNKQVDEKISAIEKNNTQSSANAQIGQGKPLAAGEYLTPGQVYNQNVDAVVAITVQVEGYDSYGRATSGISSGTGFLITQDGYVVTNYHVIEGGTKVTVTTHDDREFPAEVVGYEENNDLALLKLDATDLPCVVVGQSSQLQVGDQVVAIGNVLSTFASSLTVGYVSGVDRVVDTEGVAMNMIQTDVAINSGNSGGPLFNMKGEVVGITTAKFSGNSSSGVSIEGIGFAIPVDDVVGMIQDLKTHGYVTGAYLGVMVRDVDANAQYYGLPAGAFVESVSEGAAAQKGGIKAQDIITEVGSYKVTSVSDLTRVLRKFEAGETVTVKVYRGGQNVSCLVTLDEKPREEQTTVQEQPQTTPTIPQGGSFEEWFNIFRDYMG